MQSAFGVDHGDISKGLPRAVKSGGGGSYGRLMRSKKTMGANGAKHPTSRNLTTSAGRDMKGGLEAMRRSTRVDQVVGGKAGRRLRVELLNEDVAARQSGWKSGKSSGLKTGYRGRVSSKMEDLP